MCWRSHFTFNVHPQAVERVSTEAMITRGALRAQKKAQSWQI